MIPDLLGKLVLLVILARLDQQVLQELWEIQELSVNLESLVSTVLTEDEELPDKEVLPAQLVLLVLLVALDELGLPAQLDRSVTLEPQVKLELKLSLIHISEPTRPY